jgi:hypothetical protein
MSAKILSAKILSANIKHTDRLPCDDCGAPADIKPDDGSMFCAACYLAKIGRKIKPLDAGKHIGYPSFNATTKGNPNNANTH